MNRKYTFVLKGFVLGVILLSVCLNAQQWRGPERNGVFPETGLLKEWPENGPPSVWQAEGVGDGFGSVSVQAGITYVTGKIDSLEYLTALDDQGEILWQSAYGNTWSRSFPESRATPTIYENRIYVISGSGDVVCLNRADGKILWSVNAYEKYEGACGTWGTAESPLVSDGKVIYTPGGHKTTMAALDAETGETVWMSECIHDTTAYVSPILIEYGGKQAVCNVTANYIFGVDISSGALLWKDRYGDIDRPMWHPRAPVINCNSPVFEDGYLFVTSGYNHTGVMYSVSESNDRLEFVWKDSTLDCHVGGVVKSGDYIYGSNWIDNRNGNWCCVQWRTGTPMYEKEWENKGSIIAADGMLYCYDERRGNVALVEPTPEDFKVVSSFRIKPGKGMHWARPVIDNGLLYIRHGDVVMTFDIKDWT